MSAIVTGDDVALPATLKKDSATFLIDPAATVKASLVSLDKQTILIAPVVCDNGAVGADWANSLVIVQFSSAETLAVTEYKPALLEIQVDDTTNTDGKLTWFLSVDVEEGTIT